MGRGKGRGKPLPRGPQVKWEGGVAKKGVPYLHATTLAEPGVGGLMLVILILVYIFVSIFLNSCKYSNNDFNSYSLITLVNLSKFSNREINSDLIRTVSLVIVEVYDVFA